MARINDGGAGVYTRGSIEKTMLITALTMLPSTLALSGYNIADSYFAGQLKDPGALAAMSNTGPIVMFVGCVFMGVGTGIMANLAHALGRRDSLMSRRLVSSGLMLASLCALVLAIIGLSCTRFIFGWMGVEGETLIKTRQYMDIWFLGCITAVLSMEGNSLLITAGIPKLASLMSIVCLVLNVIFDPLLMFGKLGLPAMGIRGAALATVLAQAISAIVNMIILHRQHLLSFEKIPFGEIFSLWRTIIRYAVPATLGALVMPIGMYITQRFTYDLSKIIGYQDDLVAGIGQAGRLESIAFMFPMSLGRTLMPMIGQNYGAKLYSRVRKCFWFSLLVAQGLLLIMAVVFFFGFRYIVPYMAPGQLRVQQIMILVMMIVPWGFGCNEGARFCGFALMGCGHPRIDAILKITRIAIFHVPLAWLALCMESMHMLLFARLITDVACFAIAFALAYIAIKKLPADGCDVENMNH